MLDKNEYLISYSNLKNKFYKNQNSFLSEEQVKKYYKKNFLGFPICLPIGIKYFDYSKANFFTLSRLEFAKKIFGTTNINYVGVKKFFRYGSVFAYNAKLKKKFKPLLYKFTKKNNQVKNKIKALKNNYHSICAMQIRNIPHKGHEAVFDYLLSKFDLLVLNPILGIKKEGDVSDKLIIKALKFYENNNKRIKCLPIYSSFHYAGPREALNHMSLREALGFNYFYIGRDHAGAENLYYQSEASNFVKKYKNLFNINPITSSGGFYCKFCKIYLIKGERFNKNKLCQISRSSVCKHKYKLLNISGTEFRKKIFKKKLYKHANITLQKLIMNFI